MSLLRQMKRRAENATLQVKTTQGVLDALQEVMNAWTGSPPETQAEASQMRNAAQNVVAHLGIQAWLNIEGGELLIWFQRGQKHITLVADEGDPS